LTKQDEVLSKLVEGRGEGEKGAKNCAGQGCQVKKNWQQAVTKKAKFFKGKIPNKIKYAKINKLNV
jgi:hypothetical protein